MKNCEERALINWNFFCRIRKYLIVQNIKLLANAFINSQFIYIPLFWALNSKSSIRKIPLKLQVVYSNYDKSYHELLSFSNGFFDPPELLTIPSY